MPGLKVTADNSNNKYAFLENEEIINTLHDFRSEDFCRIVFSIPSIHCSSCIWLLENLNRINQSIISSSVNFTKKELTVAYHESGLTLRNLVELLVQLNYAPHFSLERLSGKKESGFNKRLLIKIGVAGFAFGNIMLFSMPYYIPGKEIIEEPFKNFFTFLNLFLSIPVVFFSGSDYLKSGFKNLYYHFIDINLPIAIGILAIFFQSIYETISQTGHGYYDSLSGLIFFLLIGRWYQDKTYRALSFERDYKSYFPIAVTTIIDNKEQTLPLNKLTIGDKILIRNQELIPADAKLLSDSAYIDYSFVTGESRPVKVEHGNQIFAGGRQIGSAVLLEINKMVDQSRLTDLWNQENFKNSQPAKMVKIIDRVSKTFTLIILITSVLTALFWFFNDKSIALKAFSAVLIVACPCALALSIPFAFGNIMRLFGRIGFYLKRSEVVEKLNIIDTIVFDKTGTLTDQERGEITFIGDNLNDISKEYIYLLTKNSTHPYSQILAKKFSEFRNDHNQISEFMEIPSSGIKAKINGISVKLGSEEFVAEKKSVMEDINTGQVWYSVNQNIMGYFNIKAKFRDGLDSILKQFSQKYQIHVISGDNDSEKETLSQIFPEKSKFCFNMSPEDKLKYIRNLQKNGRKVLMIGDGLNDAGALRESLVGISIADSIYHFSPACDAILEAEKFSAVSKFIKTSKNTVFIVKTSFIISFLYNLLGLSFAVRGLLTPVIAAILMPLSSVSVVLYVVLFTGLAFRHHFNSDDEKIKITAF